MKARALYSYDVTDDGKTLRIIDKSYGIGVTVTNDAEAVLTEIRELEGVYIESLDITYRDSEGNWDRMIPSWTKSVCTSVEFRPGATLFAGSVCPPNQRRR